MTEFPEETMLGPGGVTLIPESETKQLRKILGNLLHVDTSRLDKDSVNRINKAIGEIKQLECQVSRGYHRNPNSREKFLAGRVVGKIGKDVHDIRYTHNLDGLNYKHAFEGDAQVYAVERNGRRDLLITHRSGLPLWDEF